MALDSIILSEKPRYLLSRRLLLSEELSAIIELTESVRKNPKERLAQDKLDFLSEQIVACTSSSYSPLDKNFIALGIEQALRGYAHKIRKDNNVPYFVHPYRVAKMLATFSARYTSIIAGLLHDLVEEQIDKRVSFIVYSSQSERILREFEDKYKLHYSNFFESINDKNSDIRYLFPDLNFSSGLPVIIDAIERMTHAPDENYFDYLSRLLGIGESSTKNKNNLQKSQILSSNLSGVKYTSRLKEVIKFEARARSSTIKIIDQIDNIGDTAESILKGNSVMKIGNVAFLLFKSFTYWNYSSAKLNNLAKETKSSYLYKRLDDITGLFREISVYYFSQLINYYNNEGVVSLSEQRSIKDEVVTYIKTPNATKLYQELKGKFDGLVNNVYRPGFEGNKKLIIDRDAKSNYRDLVLFTEYFIQEKPVYQLFNLRTKIEKND